MSVNRVPVHMDVLCDMQGCQRRMLLSRRAQVCTGRRDICQCVKGVREMTIQTNMIYKAASMHTLIHASVKIECTHHCVRCTICNVM